MKVLIISKSYLFEAYHQKLKELAKFSEMKLTLITPRYWRHPLGDLFLEKKQAEEYKISVLPLFFNGNYFLYFYPSLGKVLRSLKPDIVHIEDEPPYLSTFQVVYLCRRYLPRTKILFFTWENIYKRFKMPFSYFEKYTLSKADYAIAGNRDAKGLLLKKGFRKGIEILPLLGVDPSFFVPQDSGRLKEGLGLGAFTIGYIGRITEAKGLIILLKAAAALKSDFQLLIVGRGDYKPRLIQEAKELGVLDRIVFRDTVEYKDVPKYLNCLDVLVLPSQTTANWKEQFGHILIEAMSCQIAVIGSDSGEIPNVIGKAGLIFKEGDDDDLKAKIELLMQDGVLRSQLTEKAKKRILENYTHKNISRRYYEVYEKLFS